MHPAIKRELLWETPDKLRGLEKIGEDLYFFWRSPVENVITTMPSPGAYSVTVRERQVMDALIAGLVNKEIAQTLGMSVRTVKFHASSLYEKFGVSSRLELSAKLMKGHDISVVSKEVKEK